MKILSVETSGRTGSVALFVNGECLVEQSLQTAGRRHAQTLVAEAQRVMTENGARLFDCSAVAVSHGPGSFTGLRVGIVFAKTMAYATGCKIIAVNTMDSIAQRVPPARRLHVICDAQRGDVFLNVFEADDSGEWSATGPTTIQSAEEWFSSVSEDDRVSGPAIDRFSDLVGHHPNLVEPQRRLPTAGSQGILAIQAFRKQDFTDPFQLEPFYLRKSAAEEKWDAENQPSGQ